jgi:hypothetical protein
VPGYLLAVVLSACALGLTFVLTAILDDLVHFSMGVDDFIMYLSIGVFTPIYGLIYGWPAALVGCTLVHLICLPVTSQKVHVAVAGLAGVATGLVYETLLFSGDYLWLSLQLGIATMVGRAAVIPLARRRQS